MKCNVLERLPHCVTAQIDYFHQVITRAGQELGPVLIEVQRRYAPQQLQLIHDSLCSKHTNLRNISDWATELDIQVQIWALDPNHDSPDVPETNFLIEVSAHHTLLRADDVITARTSKHCLHAWERGSY